MFCALGTWLYVKKKRLRREQGALPRDIEMTITDMDYEVDVDVLGEEDLRDEFASGIM